MRTWLKDTKFVENIDKSDGLIEEAVKSEVLSLTDNQKKILKKGVKAKNFSGEHFFRRLLDFLKPNSEFDILLVVKQQKTIIQIEVKSATINQEEKKEKSLDTVKMRYSSARDQLLKGKEMFKKITQLNCNSSDSWKHVGLVCFPYIKSRKDIANILNPEDLKVKQILVSQ